MARELLQLHSLTLNTKQRKTGRSPMAPEQQPFLRRVSKLLDGQELRYHEQNHTLFSLTLSLFEKRGVHAVQSKTESKATTVHVCAS